MGTPTTNYGALNRAKQKSFLRRIVNDQIDTKGFIGYKEDGEKHGQPPTYVLQHGGGSVYQPYSERVFTREGIARAILTADERPLVGPGSWVSRAGEYPLFDGGDVEIPQFWAFLDLDFKFSAADSVLFLEEGRTNVGLIFATGIMRAISVLGGEMKGDNKKLFESCLACISHTGVREMGKGQGHKVGIHVVMRNLFVEQATMLCIVEEMNKKGTVTSNFLEINGFCKDVMDCQPYKNPVTLRLPGVWKSVKCHQCKGGQNWKDCHNPECCSGTATLTKLSAYEHAGFWKVSKDIKDICADLVDEGGWRNIDSKILKDIPEKSIEWWRKILELHDISFTTTVETNPNDKTMMCVPQRKKFGKVGFDAANVAMTQLFIKIKIAMCRRFLAENKQDILNPRRMQDLIDPVTRDFVKSGIVNKIGRQENNIENPDTLTKVVTEFSRNQWGHLFQIQPGDHVTSVRPLIHFFQLFKLDQDSLRDDPTIFERHSLGIHVERSHFSTIMWSTSTNGVLTMMRHDVPNLPRGSTIERVSDHAEFTISETRKNGSRITIETTKDKTLTEDDLIDEEFRIKKINMEAPPLQHLVFAKHDYCLKNMGLIIRHAKGNDHVSVDLSKKFLVTDLSRKYNGLKTHAVEWAENLCEVLENSAAGLKKQEITLALTVETLTFLGKNRQTSTGGALSVIFSQNVCLNLKGKQRHNSSKFQIIITSHGAKPMCTCKKDDPGKRIQGGCKNFNRGVNFRTEGAHFAAVANPFIHGKNMKKLKMGDANTNKSWKLIKKILFSHVSMMKHSGGEGMDPEEAMGMFDDENLKPLKSAKFEIVDRVFGVMNPGASSNFNPRFLRCDWKKGNVDKVLHRITEKIKVVENKFEFTQRKDGMWSYIGDVLRCERFE